MKYLSIVYSSHGEIEINKLTGEVISFSNDEIKKEYGEIARFNINEYCQYWNEQPADSYDILNLGHWNKDGKYYNPEPDFRNEVLINKREQNQ